MTDITNNFANITDLDTVEGVAIRVWFLDDGGVYEERHCRSTTKVLSRRTFGRHTEQAQCYRA